MAHSENALGECQEYSLEQPEVRLAFALSERPAGYGANGSPGGASYRYSAKAGYYR